jgi:heme-degrading monooxygenase HmoA
MNRMVVGIGAVAFAIASRLPAADFTGAPAVASQAQRAVARIWRGRTLASRADEYEKYLYASGITKIRATAGNLGVTLLRRNDGDKTEFVVMSIWESLDAVKNYAGVDFQKAVILPRDRDYLLEVEPNVLHYEIVVEQRTQVGAR